jgi:hypothetical protein
MNKFKEIYKQGDYDSKASSFSKLIIAVFFISSVYMMLTTGSKVGWIGIVFLIVGLFLSSIIIAMPFFIIKRMFPKFSVVIMILSIIATFFITKVVFNLVFSEPKEIITSFVLPDKFSNDSKMFKESLSNFSEASDITNGSDRNASKEQTEKVLSLTQSSIENGKNVSDEFLDYLDYDLKNNYHEKFLKSQQLYFEGLSQSKDTDTIESESVKKQIEAGKLMNEWLGWWGSNDKEIIDKIFSGNKTE